MSWCGRLGGSWKKPCRLDVVTAVAFLIVTALVAGFQLRRVDALRKRRIRQSCVRAKLWTLAVDGAYAGVAAAHLAWLAVVSGLSSAAGFRVLTEALFSVAWLSVLVSSSTRAAHRQSERQSERLQPT